MFNGFSSVAYFRNFIFGVEDSLVSTVGLLSGVAVAGVPRETILLTGVVLIFVEAISMAAGSFLSEYSAEGYATKAENPSKDNFISGAVMFFSYFVSGFVPLFPYLLWPIDVALQCSVALSVVALFFLGIIGARISGTNVFRNGFRMAVVGGVAITVGMLAGNILSKI
ncbi:MAG: hypothetical protein A3B91_01820 [Candidatus Yanofskybacteria bacterium RIFCSPHIGHO2_02_FULL_41_29]|uniref:VIT family protein n=1 Tax=Candidatus Yanofskybacteria bacterium RIFCSPHIGHO2_01_FULL_41_53 TaxID=1802663 RepID=A0A1F8EH51_9BACT|nr:MAG: hypothetical protein A2650_04260 [Candidatus Yanofskybacteria bacterium RIFCSPHIGHO2_01_FULL_41_53]OGN11199.1 MAG: hypothetical protein A3B91_01820 [Candidatus Yanofskybacteria bacterium RIFCSPHIGHO2_02_FULL_41_29]OGN16946.1 MAG: hypothetical protein A3F48_00815 [Candidatus Yanofskybacteria bacterium RIFCSPHIGHO2_12_FULL_41_9]OGN22265.1 MAG: hypothetical protein A2916_04065 [Candidatus Yanofskybacteria bacterium RIFCSPLOWO2_01_FULL_41_67]OGN29633.1 MAG: hypothetical protein A3H54_00705 